MAEDFIKIRGARVHNLKNISLDIPRGKLVVITGVSGSGKSSLAFDTIYAEGQRRYVESLSSYARQFLERVDKPDVDSIEGLSPAISIAHRSGTKNPRSTVGTVTEIHDYLRVLFARVGRLFCPRCGIEIRPLTVQEMVDEIIVLGPGTKLQVLAPLQLEAPDSLEATFSRLRRDGFTRVKLGDEVVGVEEAPYSHPFEGPVSVIVDRLVLKDSIKSRLTDSVELALSLSGGKLLVEVMDQGERFFTQKPICPDCGFSSPELSPQLFSFNNPRGACPSCSGIGTKMGFDPELVIPDPKLPLNKGAIAPWTKRHSTQFIHLLETVCRHYGVDIEQPFEDLDPGMQAILLYGSRGESIRFSYLSDKGHLSAEESGQGGEHEKGRYFYEQPFEGVLPALERQYREATNHRVREELEQYMSPLPCKECGGARLRQEALHVKVAGKNIHEICTLPLEDAYEFFNSIKLPSREAKIASQILKEVKERIGFLVSVGVGYLTLERATSTLSGGEAQRIRLATQIGSSLAGVLYVLDEPTIGLHQRDTLRLLTNLNRLKELGNTVVVVEHDRETILAADHVIDMGPGGGEKGGEVLFEGRPDEIVGQRDSVTGQYLSGARSIFKARSPRRGNGHTLVIEGARENNLKEITVEIPLGTFTCVTGVSGSGKSTLVYEVLYPYLSRLLYGTRTKVGRVREIRGVEQIDKVIRIDQDPIGKSPRSSPATYTGVFSHIRALFAQIPEARARGYKAGRFSFNMVGGRCEVCQGEGIIKVEMHFLPDIHITCEACGGRRYNRDTLEIKYKGYDISQVLDMTVEEAFVFFERITSIRNILMTLLDVGLGYLKLGQPATTLSGGEAQRIKLSRELSKKASGRTLYLLDEPTTGLHFADIDKLLQVLNTLVDRGNTVVVIEHNLEVIRCADYIIDLGPEGGDEGGRVVASGRPEEIARVTTSHTGRFLRPFFH